MELEWLAQEFSVGKWPANTADRNVCHDFWFYAKTDQEVSILCPSAEIPQDATSYEHHWRGFRVSGQLEFSLVGILSKIAGALAEAKISIFAVSTFDTDYIFIKKENQALAQKTLELAGWRFLSS